MANKMPESMFGDNRFWGDIMEARMRLINQLGWDAAAELLLAENERNSHRTNELVQQRIAAAAETAHSEARRRKVARALSVGVKRQAKEQAAAARSLMLMKQGRGLKHTRK